MSFKEFDNSENKKMKEQYADEVKERWGNTKAYEESVQKSANGSDAEGMKQLLKEFSKHLNEECTDDILLGLGQMYVADERFLEFVDQYGKGTAQLVCDGIGIYCKKGR